ncbi:MAG: hypothetical protein ABIR68_07815 [Ilumatobacteraceae bacterium]
MTDPHTLHSIHPPDRRPNALDLARWAEDRLFESTGPGAAPARLYGLEVLDGGLLAAVSRQHRASVGSATTAARLVFLGEAADAGALVLGPVGVAACQFDAAVLASSRWEPAVSPLPRPGEHLVRRRARVVVVVAGAGVATATRFEHDPDHVLLARGLAWGGAASVQLAAMWNGARE